MKKLTLSFISIVFLFAFTSFLSPRSISAHCDTLDGLVDKAAEQALDTGNVNYILIWVKPESEDEIKKALKKAQNKRKKARSKKEKEGVDMELFETLVRVHREGEGAKFEGIKPAGSIEPEIALADKAVEKDRLEDVLHQIHSEENKKIISHLFHKIRQRAKYEIDDVIAGRRYIEAYVTFIHAVEKAIKGETLQIDHLHGH